MEFSGGQFTKSSAKILVDKSWETQVKRLDELALSCKVRIHVLKSFVLHADKSALYNVREQLHPNHYIGQALSIHLYDKNERLLCDEMCLKSDATFNTFCFTFLLLYLFFKQKQKRHLGEQCKRGQMLCEGPAWHRHEMDQHGSNDNK